MLDGNTQPWVVIATFAVGLLVGVGLQPSYEFVASICRGRALRTMMAEHARVRRASHLRWRKLRAETLLTGAYRKALDSQLAELEATLLKLDASGVVTGCSQAPGSSGGRGASLEDPLLPGTQAALSAAELAVQPEVVRADPVVQQLDKMLAHRCGHVLMTSGSRGTKVTPTKTSSRASSASAITASAV
mmetsp:Transcript_22670/g.61382  ORF Transcript_22670/g.61382 Transcript_22670/m.61382 type:complete len:189 (-) Transcript_22670:744-1310(-)